MTIGRHDQEHTGDDVKVFTNRTLFEQEKKRGDGLWRFAVTQDKDVFRDAKPPLENVTFHILKNQINIDTLHRGALLRR